MNGLFIVPGETSNGDCCEPQRAPVTEIEYCGSGLSEPRVASVAAEKHSDKTNEVMNIDERCLVKVLTNSSSCRANGIKSVCTLN